MDMLFHRTPLDSMKRVTKTPQCGFDEIHRKVTPSARGESPVRRRENSVKNIGGMQSPT